MADQLFGCKCTRRPVLASPSSCTFPPKQQNRRLEQNSYSLRHLQLWIYVSLPFLSLWVSTLYVYESPPFFFARGPSLSMSIIFSTVLFFFSNYNHDCVSTFHLSVCHFSHGWATDTPVRSLLCKVFHSFLLALSKIWFPT